MLPCCRLLHQWRPSMTHFQGRTSNDAKSPARWYGSPAANAAASSAPPSRMTTDLPHVQHHRGPAATEPEALLQQSRLAWLASQHPG
jgi:hypothetical protein